MKNLFMDSKRLALLLKKQHTGHCSQEELKELELWYEELNNPSVFAGRQDEDQLAMAMLQEFRTMNQQKKKPASFIPVQYILRAAAVLILICCAFLSWENFKPKQKLQANLKPVIHHTQNKYLTLKDGSKVVLKANSKISYLTSFDGKTREISLHGEAYFDIHHNASKPFIIHTGSLTTRVLGTAFNIDASKKIVVVTVTRGKVSVQDKSKLLAILTPGKQVTYNTTTAGLKKETVKAAEKIIWATESMEFEALAFRDIAKLLSQRYNIKISFNNPDLESCPITASFKGSESLEEVLDILCLTRQSAYESKQGQIIISGNGCKN